MSSAKELSCGKKPNWKQIQFTFSKEIIPKNQSENVGVKNSMKVRWIEWVVHYSLKWV